MTIGNTFGKIVDIAIYPQCFKRGFAPWKILRGNNFDTLVLKLINLNLDTITEWKTIGIHQMGSGKNKQTISWRSVFIGIDKELSII